MKLFVSVVIACVLPFSAAFAQTKSDGAGATNAVSANPRVELKTNRGTIVVELYADRAPKSAANFLQYVKEGHYNGTLFHRVVSGFVIQGGGFDRNMKQKPTHAPIVNEASSALKNDAGTLSMARTSDPNSATSQFYINLVDNSSLNYAGAERPGYAVFGRVVSGMDVVEQIARVPTGSVGPDKDVPRESVVIESAKVVSK